VLRLKLTAGAPPGTVVKNSGRTGFGAFPEGFLGKQGFALVQK